MALSAELDTVVQTSDAFLGALLLLLLPAVVSDLARRRIPLAIPAAIAVLGIARALTDTPTLATLLGCVAQTATLGALLGVAILLFRRLRPTASALGVGDAALLAAAAAWVGVSGCVAVMMIASVTLLVGVVVLAPWQGLDLKRQRPFGPGLALGLLVVLVTTRLHQP